jgi:DNA-binding MurR/RpiR family transcriptional regulator
MAELDSLFEQTRRLMDAEVVGSLVDAIGEAEKIVLIADSHAGSAAQSARNNLERGGFLAVAAENGIVDIARAVRLMGPKDLLLAFQAVPESRLIAPALKEARASGAKTAAILGAASFDSAKEADLVLFAYAQPSYELAAMILNAMAYTIGQSLRWRFPERYSGSDQSVLKIAGRIQKHGG